MARRVPARLVENLVETPKEPLLVVLLGPTCSGKTSLSIVLARRFDGEIVSCDSVAVYRGLEIGSAKPSPEQRALVAHHLLDVVEPDSFYTAGDYSRDARSALAAIATRSKLPIVTGGTGLYLRAMLLGLFPGPQRSTELRDRLAHKAKVHGPDHLYRILKRLDVASASRIHPNDVPKVVRAIEVTLAGTLPMSDALQQGRDALTGYRVVRLGLNPPRPDLYQRINARAHAMFDAGLIEETRALTARYGVVTSLKSLGYRQAAACIEGSLTLEESIAEAAQGHRNYAKRQLTWFRREPEVHWLPGFGDHSTIQEEAERVIARAIAHRTA